MTTPPPTTSERPRSSESARSPGDPTGFSPSYASARARFLAAAEGVGADIESEAIDALGPDGEGLAIDFARLGPKDAPRAVVLSSGTHGVEGFYGSAAQCRWLEGCDPEGLPEGLALVFVHAVNPYGFAWRRRVNEANIDVNRNCLKPGERYEGQPPEYDRIASLMNPARAPGRFERLPLARMGWKILRHGFSSLKLALVSGQYEHPEMLFFGGREPSASMTILASKLPALLGEPERVTHIDFHSGLGARAKAVLLLEPVYSDERLAHVKRFFPGCPLEGTGDDDFEAAYPLRGGMLAWFTHHFARIDYRPIAIEFGTQPNLRVLEALYLENLAHLYGDRRTPAYERAKAKIMEAFAPRDPAWRRAVSDEAVRMVEQAIEMTADRT